MDPHRLPGDTVTSPLRRIATAVASGLLVLSACSGSGDPSADDLVRSEATGPADPRVGQYSAAYDELSTLSGARATTGSERPASAEPPSDGRMQVLVHAKSAFDKWSRPLDPATWRRMRGLYDAMVVYSPYFDERLELFDDTFVYRDLYGLKVDSDSDQRAYENPDWVLRNADDEPVYIPFACDEPNGCPQFAADIGNTEYRAAFIDDVRRLVDLGYPGLLIDDVNMVWRLSDSAGEPSTPIDPRTGESLTLEDWNRYSAEFVEQVRDEFTDLRIMHNSLWFADSPSLGDPLIERQIAAADVIMIERGASDHGLAAGDGRYGFESLLDFVDRVHRLGGNVLYLDESATTRKEQVLNLVAGLLGNDGGDLVATEDYNYVAPDTFWDDFDIDLGRALGRRVAVDGHDGVWRRDFDRGIVVLNEPGRDETAVALDGVYVDSAGTIVDEVTLDPGEAAVLAALP